MNWIGRKTSKKNENVKVRFIREIAIKEAESQDSFGMMQVYQITKF